ncbi:hypothetical protein CL622_00570, partial [archaeon]|nr:hypothetical protein [archaeon]
LKKIIEERSQTTYFETNEIKVNLQNVDQTMTTIEETEADIFVGGDHSITYGTVKAFAKKHKNFGLIIFDAHPDLEVGTKSVSHEDYLRKLFDEKIITPEQVLLVGARAISKNEAEFIQKNNIRTVTMKQFVEEAINDTCDTIMEFAYQFNSVYVSFDIDSVDACFVPGTGYPEVGGILPREALYIIQRLKKMKNLRGFDLVEVNPKKDTDNITVQLGAEILYALLKKE